MLTSYNVLYAHDLAQSAKIYNRHKVFRVMMKKAYEAYEFFDIETTVMVFVNLLEQLSVILPARMEVVCGAKHPVSQALDLIRVQTRSHDPLREAHTARVRSS